MDYRDAYYEPVCGSEKAKVAKLDRVPRRGWCAMAWRRVWTAT